MNYLSTGARFLPSTVSSNLKFVGCKIHAGGPAMICPQTGNECISHVGKAGKSSTQKCRLVGDM